MEQFSHEIEPIYSKSSKILILGSFPSVKSRELGFYYMHPQNRFWKIIFALFSSQSSYNDKKDVRELIKIRKNILLENNIALWDIYKTVRIDGSKDSSIQDVELNDIKWLINKTNIKKVYTNGRLSDKKYQEFIYKTTKIKGSYLPSTSGANAGFNLSQLMSKWAVLKQK